MRLTLFLFGLISVFLGILPLLNRFFTLPIPTEGVVYNLMIAGLGLFAMVIGFSGGIEKIGKPMGLK